MSNAGRIFAGAVKGASKYALDMIDDRRDEEKEIRKAKLLQELQLSTQKELATFEYGLKSKQGDKNFSSADETDYVIRNSEGKEVGRRKLTAAEIRERDTALRKDDLDIENVQDQIRSRRVGDAREERYTNASIANMGKTGGKKGGGLDGDGDPDDMDIANELLYRYKSEADETAKTGHISDSAIRAAAIDIVKNSKNGAEAQQQFLTFLNNYRTGRKKTDQYKRPNLANSGKIPLEEAN